jgi:NitT/TauT family transport system permease protein
MRRFFFFIKKKATVWLAPLFVMSGFLVIWQWGSSFYTQEQLPPPFTVLSAIRELSGEGVLFQHIMVSIGRFTAGYLLAVAAAVPLGLVLGRYLLMYQSAEPLIQLLRPISPVAWFPLAVLWFGIGNAPAIFIIFYAAFFPVLLATISGVVHVDRMLLSVAANFGVSEFHVFYKVIIPAAFPHIVMGLNLAAGVAWIHLVAGEMLGAQSGIGYMIVDARNFLRTDMIIAGMLIVGLLGIIVNLIAKKAEWVVKRRWGMSNE